MKKYFDNMVFCALRRVCGACKKGGDGMAGEKILIVDDDKNICELLRLYLEKEGYAVTQAYDGEAAFEAFEREKPNLVLLDVMMPKMDGWEVCRKIREKGNTPVIMLTAKGETFDKVLGLELGADDYVVKPFSPGELVARVRAVLARTMRRDGQGAESFVFGGLAIDTASHTVTIDGEAVALTPKEFDLLVFLAANKGIALSREKILQQVWNYDYFGEDRTVDTHVKMLRSHLGKYRYFITTVWGVGYKFEPKAGV